MTVSVGITFGLKREHLLL